MPKPKKIDISDKYIRVRMHDPTEFEQDSFETVIIREETGIEAVMGVKDGIRSVQSFLFDVEKWDTNLAKKWVEERNEGKHVSTAELLGKKRIIVNATLNLCEYRPDLKSKTIVKATKESFANLNDKYFFYSEGVHEGPNMNRFYFFREELASKYLTASEQPLNYQHMREQIIGFTRDAELLVKGEIPKASIGFNGILHRLSPYMQVWDEEEGMTRDDLIKKAFFEGKLAVSMECAFDKIRCVNAQGECCGFETDDFIEFDRHQYEHHFNEDVFYGGIGIDFLGFGVLPVAVPADPEAYVKYLRTSDDGTLEAIAKIDGRVPSYHLAYAEPHLKYVKASREVVENVKKVEKNEEKVKKVEKISTKNELKCDKQLEQVIKGEHIMFDFEKCMKDVKTLSDALVMAQNILFDFKEKNIPLKVDEAKAYTTELSDFIFAFISNDNFEVGDIYTLTAKDKLDAIQSAREEEKKTAEQKVSEVSVELAKKEDAIKDLTQKNEQATTQIEELKTIEKTKTIEASISKYMNDLKLAGVDFSDAPLMEKAVKDIVKASIDDEKSLGDFKTELIAKAKQKVLENASNVMGGGSGGTNPGTKSLLEELDAAAESLKEGK